MKTVSGAFLTACVCISLAGCQSFRAGPSDTQAIAAELAQIATATKNEDIELFMGRHSRRHRD